MGSGEQTVQTISVDDGLVLYRRGKSKYLWCRTSFDGKQHRASTKSDNVDDAVKFANKWFKKLTKGKKQLSKKKKSKQKSRIDETVLINESPKLILYKWRNRKNWYARFQYKRYFDISTGTTVKKQATEIAKDWYFKIVAEIRTGQMQVSTAKKFSEGAVYAMRRYSEMVMRAKETGGRPSEEHYSSMQRILKNNVLPVLKDVRLDQITNHTWHTFKDHIYQNVYPNIPSSTLHSYKNVIRVVLRECSKGGWIDTVPKFMEDPTEKTPSLPRSWFTLPQYRKLVRATRKNITKKTALLHPQHLKDKRQLDAEEMHDYVLFSANTGMRVGELRNVRFCDCEIRPSNGSSVVLITNIKGKRGTGECLSHYGAVKPLQRVIKRSGLTLKNYRESTELLFKSHHREMFNTVLNDIGLKQTDGRPPVRRDFISLRHTYISFRLLAGAPIYDVANNCRTSVEVIEDHYARWLKPSMSKNINVGKVFGKEDEI